MPTKLNDLPKGEYLGKMEKAFSRIKKFYDDENENDLPLIALLPHKYGIATMRVFPKSVCDKANSDEDCEAMDFAQPLCNAFADILDMAKATTKLRGKEAFEQVMSDEIAYQTLTVLLAEILAGGRVDDNLDLANAPGMKKAIEAVIELHTAEEEDDDDEDDEDDECECDDCDGKCCEKEEYGEISVHLGEKKEGKESIRGYKLNMDKLTPKQFLEFLTIAEGGQNKETQERLEQFMKDAGATCTTKEENEEYLKKIKKDLKGKK